MKEKKMPYENGVFLIILFEILVVGSISFSLLDCQVKLR